MRKAKIGLLCTICGLTICSHLTPLLDKHRDSAIEVSNQTQQCQSIPYSINNESFEEHPDDIAEQFHSTEQNQIVPSYTVNNGTTPVDWLPTITGDPNLYHRPNLSYLFESLRMPLPYAVLTSSPKINQS
jgi:hypothetical protein